jgi:hypothetical protein
MDLLGKLNAIAKSAFGVGGQISRLADWRSDSPPERCDYRALWDEATSAYHPILDERIQLRLRDVNTEDHHACRKEEFVQRLRAIDRDDAAALAAESLRRYAFIAYCSYVTYNRLNPQITRLNNFGVERGSLFALRADLNWLTVSLCARKDVALNHDQADAVARLAAMMTDPKFGLSTIGDMSYSVEAVLCGPNAILDERRRRLIADLLARLGESESLIKYRNHRIMAFVERLAQSIGADPRTNPVIRAQEEGEALIEQQKRAITALSGPRLRRFFETAFAGGAFNSYPGKWPDGKVDVSEIDALSPQDRAAALFDCLRVFNAVVSVDRNSKAKPWPACKLSSFHLAGHPCLADYKRPSYLIQGLDWLFQHIARRRVALDEDMQWELLALLRADAAPPLLQSLLVVRIIEAFAKGTASMRVREELAAAIHWLSGSRDYRTREFGKAALHRLEAALRSMAATNDEPNSKTLEALSAPPTAAAQSGQEPAPVWSAFQAHARSLYGKSKPAAAWLKEAHAILGKIDLEQRIDLVTAIPERFPPDTYRPGDDALRGLIYCAAQMPTDRVAPSIAAFAHKVCFQTVVGVGIRDKRMGNACLWTLIHMPDGAGVPYLARLLNRIKYPSIKKTINAALDEAAAKAGLSRAALDDLSVPTHDLVDGKTEIAIGSGGATAILALAGIAKVAISFRQASGKETPSVPATLQAHKSEIRRARATAKEIEADLATQVGRLQRNWLERRDWSFPEWDARYARHPLIAQMVARLIWTVSDGSNRATAVLVGGTLRDIGGQPVDASEARISLWHPIGQPVDHVLAWRKRLAELEIVQPFKQAHREVYYVTDAERVTGVYSNRFAGHILRQHQMMTLARLNNWNVTHRIWADVPNNERTHLIVPAWGIVAEFWTRGAGGEDDPEVTGAGAYVYISTDQVRFYAIPSTVGLSASSIAYGPQRYQEMRMETVPEIVFSEIMRHCDLFTSVASVANDPNWIDGGTDAEHPNRWRQAVAAGYWRETAFGELTQTAESRRDTLKEILPALKIADRCWIDGRYLKVQGKVRAYRIHIGSGNVLMEPDDRYLCIVAAGSMSLSRVMLPFEGDGMLSTILSKAFLLAEDDKITDQVIVRQLFS